MSDAESVNRLPGSAQDLDADESAEALSSLAEAQTAVRRLSGESHMAGYECFGTEDKTPTLRKLGSVHFLKGGAIQMIPYADAEDWPESEVHNGVATISVSSYGDHPGGAYIYVSGPDQLAVSKAWDRTRDAWVAAHRCGAWWGLDG